MPFTLAHPAIVLPLLKINKRYISATGLVAGSVAPDLEYFIRMSVRGPYARSQTNFFLIDIPFAVVIAFLFHLVVKKNLIENLPVFIQSRVQPLRELDFVSSIKQFPWAFVFSFGIGIASHWLWDSFTHPGSFFVEHLPFYDGTVPYEGVNYPMYYALQNISTAAGILAIVLYILFMKPDPAARLVKPATAYWIVVVLISLMIMLLRFYWMHEAKTYGNLAVASITAVSCAVLAAGVLRFKRPAR